MNRQQAAVIADQIATEWGAQWGRDEQNHWIDEIEKLPTQAARRAADLFRRVPGAKLTITAFLAEAGRQSEHLADLAKPQNAEERFKLSDDTIATGRRHIDTIMNSLAKRGVTTARRTQ